MDFDFIWESEELERQLLELEGEDGLKNVTEETLVSLSENIHDYCKQRLRVSKDYTKSGRHSGSLNGAPTGHSRDNIPISNFVTTKDGFMYKVVGWEKQDTSPWFYNKFQEWGTSNIAPNPVFSVVKTIYQGKLDEVYRDKLEEYLKKVLG